MIVTWPMIVLPGLICACASQRQTISVSALLLLWVWWLTNLNVSCNWLLRGFQRCANNRIKPNRSFSHFRYGILTTTRSTQPSIPLWQVNRVPDFLASIKAGRVYLRQVPMTSCDQMWQVTLRRSETKDFQFLAKSYVHALFQVLFWNDYNQSLLLSLIILRFIWLAYLFFFLQRIQCKCTEIADYVFEF